MLKFIFLLVALSLSINLISTQPDILIYDEGNIQVNSQINEFENPVAGKPLQGSILITHDLKNKIDKKSFQLGNQTLDVTFVKTIQMPASNLVVSIYSFQINALKEGPPKTLPPISVKVDGKRYQAPPLTIKVK